MEITLIIVFVLTALLLNLVIVLQPGKGGGMGAIGGGGGTGGASSVFGARGAVPLLSKLTGWLAAIFMLLSLGLARISLDKSAVTVSALKPAAAETTGAGAGDEETKSDEIKTEEAAKPAEAKTEEAAKPAEAAPEADKKAAEEPKKEEGGE